MLQIPGDISMDEKSNGTKKVVLSLSRQHSRVSTTTVRYLRLSFEFAWAVCEEMSSINLVFHQSRDT